MFSDCFGATLSLRPTIFYQICVHLLLFRNHAQSCCKSAYVTAMFSIYTRSCQHSICHSSRYLDFSTCVW